jgi:hypothetical protein
MPYNAASEMLQTCRINNRFQWEQSPKTGQNLTTKAFCVALSNSFIRLGGYFTGKAGKRPKIHRPFSSGLTVMPYNAASEILQACRINNWFQWEQSPKTVQNLTTKAFCVAFGNSFIRPGRYLTGKAGKGPKNTQTF